MSDDVTVTVRRARPAELGSVGDLTVRAYVADGLLSPDDPYAARLRDATQRSDDAELWVAVDARSDELLGSVTFCPPGSALRELASDSEGEFRMLAVDPPARGRGAGRALAAHCLGRSIDYGFTEVVICSLPTMTAAHALYASLGFERDSSLDWSPRPGVRLWGFRTRLGARASA